MLGLNLAAGETAQYDFGGNRFGYLVPAKGTIEVNGVRLEARDGAAIREEGVITVKALDDAEVVLVDTAP